MGRTLAELIHPEGMGEEHRAHLGSVILDTLTNGGIMLNTGEMVLRGFDESALSTLTEEQRNNLKRKLVLTEEVGKLRSTLPEIDLKHPHAAAHIILPQTVASIAYRRRGYGATDIFIPNESNGILTNLAPGTGPSLVDAFANHARSFLNGTGTTNKRESWTKGLLIHFATTKGKGQIPYNGF